MAKDNSDCAENIDKNKSKSIDSVDEKNAEPSSEEKQEDKKSVTIKNAHASGDGSYGRNDGSLPEDEQDKKNAGASY